MFIRSDEMIIELTASSNIIKQDWFEAISDEKTIDIGKGKYRIVSIDFKDQIFEDIYVIKLQRVN